MTFYYSFLFQIILCIVVQLLQKFNEAGLEVIKTANLDKARRRKRLFRFLSPKIKIPNIQPIKFEKNPVVMKRLSYRFVFFGLFHLLITANILFAQEPYGKITGNVADERGPVANAKISVKLKNSFDYNSIQITSTDDKGYFSVMVRLGVYEVRTESSCMSAKNEDVQITSEKPVNLALKLVFEDCASKTAEESLEWETCEQATNVAGIEASDSDKAEIVNQILGDLSKYETNFLYYRADGIILSTANIKSEWVKSFPNLKPILLTEQQIIAKANKTDGLGLGYLLFGKWRVSDNCAIVGLTNLLAANKKRKVFYCPVGSSMTYLFRKESGQWKIKQSKWY